MTTKCDLFAVQARGIFVTMMTCGLQKDVMDAMKTAMKEKDSAALEALRAIKSALLLAQTESGAKKELTETEEVKLLQKLELDAFLCINLDVLSE